MNNARSINENNILNNNSIWSESGYPEIREKVIENYSSSEIISSEEFTNFFNYLKLIGLSKDQGLIVLPPKKHYYYEAEELKEVKTIINLKQLNHIDNLMGFFYSIFRLLPVQSCYVGCFFDNKNQSRVTSGLKKPGAQQKGQTIYLENNIESGIPFINKIYNLIDFRTTKYLTKRSVTLLLEEADLKVLDMTVINELTYFCTQKCQAA